MTTSVETKAEKAERLAKLGYLQSERDGRCCLCGKGITIGMYVGKLPDGWQPRSRLRWAHRRCVEQLKEAIRAKAGRLGIVVPPDGGDAHG